jgi:predicted amidohydrolase
MKMALIQMNIAWESKKANYAKAENFFRRASRESCDIIVFPEMFSTGFSMNIPAIAEDERGETFQVLSELAKKYGLNVIAGFAAKTQGRKKARNLAIAIDRHGTVIATYAKMHPFSLTKEDKYFSSGNTRVIFQIEEIFASVFICYDLRFPEIFRDIARGVQAIFVLANWPDSRKDHWETLLKARAIENQCFVIGVNRTGKDGNGIRYPGASHVYDPMGKDICSGGLREQFITCEIDPEMATKVRCQFPFLNDMRS